jgi:hypothetical protein
MTGRLAPTHSAEGSKATAQIEISKRWSVIEVKTLGGEDRVAEPPASRQNSFGGSTLHKRFGA